MESTAYLARTDIVLAHLEKLALQEVSLLPRDERREIEELIQASPERVQEILTMLNLTHLTRPRTVAAAHDLVLLLQGDQDDWETDAWPTYNHRRAPSGRRLQKAVKTALRAKGAA